MRLSTLLEHLQTLADELAARVGDTDPEVTITYQESLPLESHVLGVAILADPPRMTLVEGHQIGYGASFVFDPSEHLA